MQIGHCSKFSSTLKEDLICWNPQWLLPRHSSGSVLLPPPPRAGSCFWYQESYLPPWKSCSPLASSLCLPPVLFLPLRLLHQCTLQSILPISPFRLLWASPVLCSFSSPSYLYRILPAKIIQLIIHCDYFLDLLILSRPLLSCPNEYLSLSLWHFFTGADPSVQDQYGKN